MRCFLFAACCCLLISFDSFAQESWVLWKKSELTEREGKYSTAWSIIEAFSNFDACLTAQKSVFSVLAESAMKDELVKTSFVSPRLVSRQYKNEKNILSHSEELFCLPGCLDPRSR